MKRQAIQLADIAERKNLELALWRAAQGKRDRTEVIAFFKHFDANMNLLAANILSNQSPTGTFRSFTIHDPKVRQIHAACFADRVLHHAILNLTEHVFEQTLVATTFACRPDKGVHQAVVLVRRNLQRFQWYAKIDIDSYFASINHTRLMLILSKKFKGAGFLAMLSRLIDSTPGQGLPIGSLTSQHFANLYLDGADRFLTETCKALGHVRYMDDILWWGDSPHILKGQLAQFKVYLCEELGLTAKPSSIQIQPSSKGVSYCGYRIQCGEIFASRRKLRRYAQNSEVHTEAFEAGVWSASHVQRAADGLAATLAHCQTADWRAKFWAARNWNANV
jgi:RNA-directed DNA polymerase